MTYKEAYDKIIQAYFRDEILPYEEKFCICGTLAGGYSWLKSGYTPRELRRIEAALLVNIHQLTAGFIGEPIFVHDNSYELEGSHDAYFENKQVNAVDTRDIKFYRNYEDALFAGMVASLEVLKQIHLSRGENVDDVVEFKKRELICQI